MQHKLLQIGNSQTEFGTVLPWLSLSPRFPATIQRT
jgi:hypothetical protein